MIATAMLAMNGLASIQPITFSSDATISPACSAVKAAYNENDCCDDATKPLSLDAQALLPLTSAERYQFTSGINYASAPGKQQGTRNLDVSDDNLPRTQSYLAQVPIINGHMSTHAVVRSVSVAENVMTFIGEGKHGLWKYQDNGYIRYYIRVNTKTGTKCSELPIEAQSGCKQDGIKVPKPTGANGAIELTGEFTNLDKCADTNDPDAQGNCLELLESDYVMDRLNADYDFFWPEPGVSSKEFGYHDPATKKGKFSGGFYSGYFSPSEQVFCSTTLSGGTTYERSSGNTMDDNHGCQLGSVPVLSFVDIPIHHKMFGGKYSQHVPIDMPAWTCTMSEPMLPYSSKAWEYALQQHNSGPTSIGPLGRRAGLDVVELYPEVVRMHGFPDMRSFAQVGLQGVASENIPAGAVAELTRTNWENGKAMFANYQAIDPKQPAEYYLIVRPFMNVRYLWVWAIYDTPGQAYIRPSGMYYQHLKGRYDKASETAPCPTPAGGINDYLPSPVAAWGEDTRYTARCWDYINSISTPQTRSHKYPMEYYKKGVAGLTDLSNYPDGQATLQTYSIPSYGVNHLNRPMDQSGTGTPFVAAYAGGACPHRGGDWHNYGYGGSGGGGFTNMHQEITPLCDSVVMDIKLYVNLAARSTRPDELKNPEHASRSYVASRDAWGTPFYSAGNGVIGAQTGDEDGSMTYTMSANQFGGYTDKYLIKENIPNHAAINMTQHIISPNLHEKNFLASYGIESVLAADVLPAEGGTGTTFMPLVTTKVHFNGGAKSGNDAQYFFDKDGNEQPGPLKEADKKIYVDGYKHTQGSSIQPANTNRGNPGSIVV